MSKERPTVLKEMFIGNAWDLPKNVLDLMVWFEKHLELVPEVHRSAVVFEIEAIDEWGDLSTRVSVYYHREATDEEVEAKSIKQKKAAALRKKRELSELRRLKERYPEE